MAITHANLSGPTGTFTAFEDGFPGPDFDIVTTRAVPNGYWVVLENERENAYSLHHVDHYGRTETIIAYEQVPTNARVNSVRLDPAGTLFFMIWVDGDARLWRITTDGTVSESEGVVGALVTGP